MWFAADSGRTTMNIHVVSNSADFFLDVFQACRSLAPHAQVTHDSTDSWLSGNLARIVGPALILVNQQDASALDLQPPDSSTSEKPFALVRAVCQNMGHENCLWERLSRDSVMLRIQEIGQTMQHEPVIHEEILLQSDHLRLTQFRIPTRCAFIPVIRDRLLKSIQQFDLATDTAANHFCMALEESLANAFYHGNLELCSSLKEDGSSKFVELAAQRETESPFQGRVISITELAGRFGLWITIRDEGRGFDVQAAIERANDPESLLASGRGLMMMQAFADELFFNAAGNEVTLVLYSRHETRESPVTVTSIDGIPTLLTDKSPIEG